MKTIETSKGEFVVVDATTLDKVSGQALVDEYGDYIILSEATEKDAIEVVEEYIYITGEVDGYYNYLFLQSMSFLHLLI